MFGLDGCHARTHAHTHRHEHKKAQKVSGRWEGKERIYLILVPATAVIENLTILIALQRVQSYLMCLASDANPAAAGNWKSEKENKKEKRSV